jgi:hypothetical protein
MFHRVALVRTDVSEELSASTIRVLLLLVVVVAAVVVVVLVVE